jgi:hypothetical protein
MRDSKTSADDLQDVLASQTQIRFANETPKQQAQHREIARRHRRRRGSLKTNVRVRQLERVFVDRYGPVLPDDDAGRDDVYVIANHLAHRPDAAQRIRVWVRLWAPWMSDIEIDELIAMVVPSPMKWKADPLAERIGLDDATRTRLGITIIGAVDCKKAKRARRRKERDAARHKALRAKAGARPRAASAAQTEPWKKEGKSRRTWYRHRRNGTDGTNSSAPCLTDIVVETKQCQGAPPPMGGSWARAEADGADGVFLLPRDGKRQVEALTIASSM